MTEAVYIAGVGMTRFGVHTSLTVADLARSAVEDALGDAGADLKRLDCVFFGNTTQSALEGQLMVAGQMALRPIGLERAPIYNVENACATGSTALNLAIAQVRAGTADIALAVGVEKMNVGDRERSMAVFEGAYDVSRPEELNHQLQQLGGAADTSEAGQRSIFMDIYAAFARAHMKTFGTTQAQIAAVAAKNHRHAANNERAHYRKPMTVDDVLNARALAFPLTVPMCSPLTDGAAAAIVCSQRAVRSLSRYRAIRVLASCVGSGVQRDIADYAQHISRLTAERAYAEAGIAAADVDVAEVHDATAFGEVLMTEMLELCEPGGGGPPAEKGETTLGGRIPVNPSGGLESKGHPLAATGLGQVYELVQQLRGEVGVRQVEGAMIGIAENGGGYYQGEEAVAAVTILGR
jgi:acetyl-CoA acyltransferase